MILKAFDQHHCGWAAACLLVSESMTWLQYRAGQVLRQLYDEVVHHQPKTSHTGDPPGTKRLRPPKGPGKGPIPPCHSDCTFLHS